MSFKKWAIAKAIILAIKHQDYKVVELAKAIDQKADNLLGKQSERVQQQIVEKLLLPLCKELMRETPITFQKILMDEVNNIKKESR